MRDLIAINDSLTLAIETVAHRGGRALDGSGDHIYMNVRDPKDRDLVSTDFKPMKNSKIDEVSANFDLVLGRAPADQDDHQH